VVREGRRLERSVTPSAYRAAGTIDRDRLQVQVRTPPFDLDLSAPGDRVHLGVTVVEMTPQLANYFGAAAGVLVTSVADNSPASGAGLKAGDVITSIDGRAVRSQPDLVRALRGAGASADVTIGIVREKSESTLKGKLEPSANRQPRRARPA
jgi:S1-C subfamily serine protease